MPRRCSVCTHPRRTEIDAALIAGQGGSAVALRYGLNQSSLYRHAENHLQKAIARAASAVGLASAPAKPVSRKHRPPHAAALAQSMPTLNSLSAVAERLVGVADHMKEERERAGAKGAAGIAIGAAGAERAALADLAKMIQGVQDAVDRQAQQQDSRWGDLVGVVLDAIPDEETRAAVARRLADAA